MCATGGRDVLVEVDFKILVDLVRTANMVNGQFVGLLLQIQ